MKPIKTLFTILFISLLSSPSWSVTLGDLVEREGIYYEKFTDVPFSGKVTGEKQGSFKNGKREGYWVEYYENGISFRGNFKNGKEEGAWISYHVNGQVFSKGNYKNGKEEGAWVGYKDNGQLSSRGNFKNGKKEGAWVSYKYDGQLFSRGNYKNGKKEGAWIAYDKYGAPWAMFTGTYKDGVKISD